MARQVFGGKVVDVNRFKDMTIGEILKKDYPSLQVPPTGFMGPIWKVIREKDAFVQGSGGGKAAGGSKSTARKPAAKSTASKGRAAAPAKKKSTARGR